VEANWLGLAAAAGAGLLIGLERERNPKARAGVRTFALVALFGALAADVGVRLESSWTVPVGLAAVAGLIIAAYAHKPGEEGPDTATAAAAVVSYLLGVLAGSGEPALAGSIAIGVTALLYFKPELEGFSAGLKREDQVSVLQFLVVTFIVLPILPDRGYGPHEAFNPRHIWLMVVLISGLSLAGYVASRLVGERHSVLVTGLLGGIVSSTATTHLYARRSRESAAMERVALVVISLASLMPLVRVGIVAAVLAPGIASRLYPVLVAALLAGLAATAIFLSRNREPGGVLPAVEQRNPAELGPALRFAALYAVVLGSSAWLSEIAGDRGLYATALASGTVDIDPAVLSALNLFADGRIQGASAVVAIALAWLANIAFKLSIITWFNRRLALRALGPMGATVAGGAAALLA